MKTHSFIYPFLALMLLGYARQAGLHTHEKDVAQCVNNLETIGDGLKTYELDHGVYPNRLEKLVPDYLSKLPSCPQARRETYSEGFETRVDDWFMQVGCATHPYPSQTACSDRITDLVKPLKKLRKEKGRAPTSLLELGLNREALDCPETGMRFQYRTGFRVPVIVCKGSYHVRAGSPADFPRFDLLRGVVEK